MVFQLKLKLHILVPVVSLKYLVTIYCIGVFTVQNINMRVKSQVIILRQFGMEFSLYNPLSIIMSRILMVEVSCKRIRLTRICLMSAPSLVPRIKSTDASDEDMS